MRSQTAKIFVIIALATATFASDAMAQTATQRIQNYMQNLQREMTTPHTTPAPTRGPASVAGVRG